MITVAPPLAYAWGEEKVLLPRERSEDRGRWREATVGAQHRRSIAPDFNPF